MIQEQKKVIVNHIANTLCDFYTDRNDKELNDDDIDFLYENYANVIFNDIKKLKKSYKRINRILHI